ncbi:Type IV inositol polyphosphate 5-phosphatase 11, partial [Cucurbita argyrosperma subsp. sororia]
MDLEMGQAEDLEMDMPKEDLPKWAKEDLEMGQGGPRNGPKWDRKKVADNHAKNFVMRPLNHLLRLCTGTNSKTPAPALLQHQGGAAHEGIKTVVVDEDVCSGVCIYIVTWNMNGQARYGDLEKAGGATVGCFPPVAVGFGPESHISRSQGRGEELGVQTHNALVIFKEMEPLCIALQVTVWLGDLNYRIEGISTHPARNLIRKNLLSLLRRRDQLMQEAERGRIFDGYCEGTLSFKPTYKYNVGSSKYDSSYKVRVPSWTDRILFKLDELEKISANLCSYDSMDEIYSSDHKPVKAQLCLRLTNTSLS